MSVLPKIEEIAKEVAAREGCEIYDLEFTPQRVLRVFLDKAEGQVSVDDCANVSRGLNLMLDVDDVIPGGAYNLEVSSPGLERTLKRPDHYKKVVGQKIWVRLSQALSSLGVEDPKIASAKQVQAKLVELMDAGIKLEIEAQTVFVPWDKIEKAKTVFEFGPETGGPKPKNPHGPKKKH
jgi:ribosome maturation factor RimP